MTPLLPTSFLIFSCFQIGLSFKCYNCKDSNDKNCADPIDITGLSSVNCPYGTCVKYTGMKVGSPETTVRNDKDAIKIVEGILDASEIGVYRTCEHKKFCETYKKLDGLDQFECHHCEGELCNSSSYVLPSLTFIALLYAINRLFSK